MAWRGLAGWCSSRPAGRCCLLQGGRQATHPPRVPTACTGLVFQFLFSTLEVFKGYFGGEFDEVRWHLHLVKRQRCCTPRPLSPPRRKRCGAASLSCTSCWTVRAAHFVLHTPTGLSLHAVCCRSIWRRDPGLRISPELRLRRVEALHQPGFTGGPCNSSGAQENHQDHHRCP